MPERHQKTDFILCLLIAYAGWRLLGWRGEGTLAGYDSSSHMLIYRFLAESAGKWWNNIYTPEMLGGVLIHPNYGAPLLYWIAANFHLNEVLVFNVTQICVQSWIAFFLFQWGKSEFADIPWTPGRRLLVLVALLFVPVLSWRWAMGHQSFMGGVLFFCLGLYWLRGLLFTSRFGCILFSFAFLHAITSVAPQSLIYALVFLTLYAACCSPRVPRGSILWIIGLSALGLPMVLDVLVNFVGFRETRSITSDASSVLLTSSWREWVESLRVFPSTQGAIHYGSLLHEAHYPTLSLVFMMVVVCLGRRKEFARFLVLSLFISAVVCVLPSPFRISMRVLILPTVFAWTILIFNIVRPSGIREEWRREKIFVTVVSLAWLFIFWQIGGVVREAGFFILMGLGLFSSVYRRFTVSLVIISVIVLGTYVDKPWHSILTQDVTAVSENPLRRTVSESVDPLWGANTAVIQGTSTLNGYWLPQAAFLRFLRAEGFPGVSGTDNSFLFPAGGNERIRRAYNVHYNMDDPSPFPILETRGGCSPLRDRVEQVQWDPTLKSISIQVSVASPCVLVLPMNYSRFLTTVGDVSAPVLVDSVLVGVRIEKPGRQFFRIQGQSFAGPLVTSLCGVLGLLFLFGGAYRARVE